MFVITTATHSNLNSTKFPLRKVKVYANAYLYSPLYRSGQAVGDGVPLYTLHYGASGFYPESDNG